MAPKQVRNIWPEPGVSKMAVRKVAIYREISASMQIQAAVRFALETAAGLFWGFALLHRILFTHLLYFLHLP